MTKSSYLKPERELHKQAFEYFRALGSRRKYRLVAAKFQVSVSTIKNWSRDFKWQQRIEEWEAKNTETIAEKVNMDIANGLERELKLLSLILAKGAKDLAEGRSRSTPNNMLKAIETVIRLIEKKRESVESDSKSATNLPILVMYDNGRDDCTLSSGPLPDLKAEEESEESEKEDNE